MPMFVVFTSTEGLCEDLRYYDTDICNYSEIPSPNLELTPEQRAARLAGGRWAVEDGARFVPAPPTPADRYAEAVARGMVVEPMGKTVSLDPASVDALRTAAIDFGAGLGLPGGGETFQAAPGVELTGPQVRQVYMAARDLLVRMEQAMRADAEMPDQTVTLS